MEAFLADSLYSKVLSSEGNEKVSYLSTFHDEENPRKDNKGNNYHNVILFL
jgi:hypothetical protein